MTSYYKNHNLNVTSINAQNNLSVYLLKYFCMFVLSFHKEQHHKNTNYTMFVKRDLELQPHNCIMYIHNLGLLMVFNQRANNFIPTNK